MNLLTYLKEVRAEMTRISWPSRQETIRMTEIVLGVSVAVGIYTGLLDMGFVRLLGMILK